MKVQLEVTGLKSKRRSSSSQKEAVDRKRLSPLFKAQNKFFLGRQSQLKKDSYTSIYLGPIRTSGNFRLISTLNQARRRLVSQKIGQADLTILGESTTSISNQSKVRKSNQMLRLTSCRQRCQATQLSLSCTFRCVGIWESKTNVVATVYTRQLPTVITR